MWKIIYEILISPLVLPINPIWEYLIILFVGEIVHEIAYSFSQGGRFGSLIYWITKLIVFVVIWAILYAIISVINFIISYWILFLIGAIVLAIIIIFIFIYRKRKS